MSRSKRKKLKRNKAAPAVEAEHVQVQGVVSESSHELAPPDVPGLFYRDMFVGGVDCQAEGEDRKAIDYDERRVDVVASTEALDGHGEIVEQVWRLDRYKRNPIVLWNHNSLFQQDKKPIGRAENLRVENEGTSQAALKATIIFASEKANPEAERILQLFVEGIQRAVSVGFRPGDVRREVRDERDITVLSNNELYELSATPVGSNPDALSERQQKWLQKQLGEQERGAVPYSAYEPVAGRWDADAAEKRIRKWATGANGKVSFAKYRKAFAWYNASKPEAFGSYKLPHHDVRGGSLVTVRSGVIAAGNAMQGARGGVRMPAADKPAVRGHLGKHYKQFDMVAPWDKALNDHPPAAERGGNLEEKSVMDFEEIQAALTKANERIAGLETERDKAMARADAVEAQNKVLVTERDAAVEKLASLEHAAVEAKVDALIGVKFTPVERDDQIKLAKAEPELWQRLTDQRADLTLLKQNPAGMSPEPKPGVVNAGGSGQGFADLLNAVTG